MTEQEFNKELPKLLEFFFGENVPTYSVNKEIVHYSAKCGSLVDERLTMWVSGYPDGFKWRKTWQEVYDDFHLAGETHFWEEMKRND